MTSLIWLHEDSLRDTHPVFNRVDGDYHAFFIWDNDYFKKVDYGFNRLSFIYEAMSDLPFTIYEGQIESVISELATEFSSNQLYVASTPNRMINEILQPLKNHFDIHSVPDDPFVDGLDGVVEQRFFRYWNKAKKRII